MKTYLIFFGKSQYFTTHAFDNDDYIEDFNTVIKDFDLLESKIFTVDALDNKEIFAKYHFTSREGKKYSLIKLYSFAQAFSGDRIAGSIYGVALLSEQDIALSKTNLNILLNLKASFAKLCLNGSKFNTSDFFEDVEKIWTALVNHEKGNLLDKVDYTSKKIFNTNNESRGIYVKNLFEDITALENQMDKSSRIYVSEDLEHLKRTHSKFGSQFKVYLKTNNGCELYEEPKPIEPPTILNHQNIDSKNPESELQVLKYRISDLEEENNHLSSKASFYKKKSKNIFLRLSVLSTILFLTTITFFFKSNFSSYKKDNSEVPEMDNYTEEAPSTIERKININYILDNPNVLDSFISFSKEIKAINSFNTQLNLKDTLLLDKNFKSILSKSEKFNIDISNIELIYKKKKHEIDLINKSKKTESVTIESDDKKKGNKKDKKKIEESNE